MQYALLPEHPCKGRSRAQIEAFEAIAINEQPRCSQRTIEALLAAGLIEKAGDRVLGRDKFGPITVPQFVVPLPIHLRWCQWAAENSFDDVSESN